MWLKRIGVIGALALMTVPAHAGNQSGFSHQDESGVHIFRGHHGSVISQASLHSERLRVQREAQAAQARQAAQLNAQLAAQARQIDNLGHEVRNLERSQQRPQRRRVYYGNPAFFGNNGFIGNRYYGGASVQLPRRRHHHSRPGNRQHK